MVKGAEEGVLVEADLVGQGFLAASIEVLAEDITEALVETFTTYVTIA